MRRPIVVLTVTATAFACAGHPSTRSSDPTLAPATSVTAASTTTQDPKAAVLAAVDSYWRIWLSANNPPNPNDQRLVEVLGGAALEQTLSSMRMRLAAHELIRLPAHALFRHAIERIAWNSGGTVARVRECVVDDSQLVAASGAILNGATATYELEKTLARGVNGGWRIVLSVQRAKWPGVAGCALSAP
jgi:hypothetical protein